MSSLPESEVRCPKCEVGELFLSSESEDFGLGT
jgi:hypothetical protein